MPSPNRTSSPAWRGEKSLVLKACGARRKGKRARQHAQGGWALVSGRKTGTSWGNLNHVPTPLGSPDVLHRPLTQSGRDLSQAGQSGQGRGFRFRAAQFLHLCEGRGRQCLPRMAAGRAKGMMAGVRRSVLCKCALVIGSKASGSSSIVATASCFPVSLCSPTVTCSCTACSVLAALRGSGPSWRRSLGTTLSPQLLCIGR